MHKETHQFIDIVEMLQPMTKWNARVHDPRMIGEAVRKAFSVAAAEKPGATHLELPEDVMAAQVVGRPMQRAPLAIIEPDAAALQRAATLLQNASRPVLLVGNGVVRQGASQALRDFCRQTGLHVITTFMGKGVIDSDDEHFLFTAGLRAQNYPQGLMGRADLVVARRLRHGGVAAVGVEPGRAAAHRLRRHRAARDRRPLRARGRAHRRPRAHPHPARLPALEQADLTSYEVPPYRRAFRQVLDAGTDDDFPVKPQRVLRDLRAALAPEDLLISDVGAHKLWVARFWEAKEPNTVLISNGFAAMGFALPAAIAAALALRGRRKVVAICGDGGFLMNVQELETARRLGLPFVVLVWSDGGYGLIEMHQRRKFAQGLGDALRQPRLRRRWRRPSAARACASSAPGDLRRLLAQALAARGPVVVEIPIDYAENDKLGIDLWKLAPEAWPSL